MNLSESEGATNAGNANVYGRTYTMPNARANILFPRFVLADGALANLIQIDESVVNITSHTFDATFPATQTPTVWKFAYRLITLGDLALSSICTRLY